MHGRDKHLGPDVNLEVVARGTPGFSGADLANLANEAAIFAVREGRDVLTAGDFSAARDRILLGRREGSNVLLPEEKRAVAVHESGRALVAALSEHAGPVEKVTILPAGQALGVTEQLPLVERHLYGEDYLTDSLRVRLGGRAAELVEFGQGSTGAANDLASATEMATKMIREFGLSPKLGPIAEWGLDIQRKQLKVDTATFSTNVPGLFAVGDINTYPGKKKLILSGFHEAALAAFGAAPFVFPDKKIMLQYTTTSPKLHKVLGVETPVFD